ncbi:hypothetical protein PFISCL1PPCAC_6979, partial [Pristionchus fissidentatus]
MDNGTSFFLDPLNNATEAEKCAALVKSTIKTTGWQFRHHIFVYAQLLYVIPTMVYIKFLIVALVCGKNRHKRYSNIFYKFILMGAATAVLIHIPRSVFEIIGKRPNWFCPTFRSLSQPSFWLNIYVYLMQIGDTLRIFAGTMIVIYRFHSLVDIFSAKRLWDQHSCAIILGTMAIPAVLYAPIWATPSYAMIDDEEMVFQNKGLSWYNDEAVHCLVVVVCALIVLGLQAILCVLKTPTKSVGDGLEWPLYVVGMVETVVIPLYAIFESLLFARDYFDRTLPSWILYTSLIVSDALGFCPPWALFITSHEIREDATPFRRLFIRCCRRQSANINPL